MTTIFTARRIHTIDDAGTTAEAVAVNDAGHIDAVGSLADLQAAHPDAAIDATYADAFLLPGFVEAHAHLLEGIVWAFEYVGYFDRRGADGVIRPGSQSTEAVLTRLRELHEAMDDPNDPLVVWGFDPIYLPGERLVAAHLDTVSETRPIFVFHASGHLATVNTALMEREGFADGVATKDMDGVPTDADGIPIGELQEPAAMGLAREAFRKFWMQSRDPQAIVRMGQAARWAGLTTSTELGVGNLGSDQMVDTWLNVTGEPDFPIRISAFHNATSDGQSMEDMVARLIHLREQSTDKMRFGHVKLILDGSIQGFTARLNAPGYLPDEDGNARPNGIWLMAPERFREVVEALHVAGILMHVHCNGDEALDLFLDTFTPVIDANPRPDHRHTAQHSQLTTPEQYRALAAIGANANIFSNHIWYWGDQHHDITVGPERAATMDACNSADEAGVRYSIHCDASVTPFGSLHVAWCAVNRVTPQGRVLGADECISVDRAMRAITIDAAHQIHMDDEIGSIEPGKLADFVALAESPWDVDPMELRNIDVLGTVLGGRHTVPS